MIKRKLTRQIHIGPVAIGGGAPVSVQSMTNTKTTDTAATVAQIRALTEAGCDIVRLAVPDMEAAKNLGNIISAVDVPLVADIHFDYRLALEAMQQGIAALGDFAARFDAADYFVIKIAEWFDGAGHDAKLLAVFKLFGHAGHLV